MNTSTILAIILIGAAMITVLLILFQFQRRRKTEELKGRFGPEYARTIQETGSKTRGEEKLTKLEKRVERLHIHPLPQTECLQFAESWRVVQAKFVDNPQQALRDADSLLGMVMSARGYPVADFEERAAEISVDHPLVVIRYRAGHDIAIRHSKGQANTEDLRQAMVHYRALFDEMIAEPAMAQERRAG
jgi:hypothetical protein